MLKVAVIGCGNISGSHIKAYLEFPELCQITALCDIYPEKAEKRKAEFGLTEARYMLPMKNCWPANLWM